MIHRVFSSLTGFKELEFHPGLNVLVARKAEGSSDKQTRNRAGKTSLIEIITFVLGARVERNSLFRSAEIEGESFGITFDLGEDKVTAERAGATRGQVRLTGSHLSGGETSVSHTDWKRQLGDAMFGLHDADGHEGRKPTFRSLISYFIRRQTQGAFSTPEKSGTKQKPCDSQMAILNLLGLDWRIASKWQGVRDRETALRELKKAAGTGALGSFIGKASELRTQLTVAEDKLAAMEHRLVSFRVHPDYAELESEANRLTRLISEFSNANVIDRGTIRDLEAAIQSEAPPPLQELESVYREAGLTLPELAIKRYSEVQAFHESVIRNRKSYLDEELKTARQRILKREKETDGLDRRRAELMRILESHGALDQYSQLRAEVTRVESEVEALRQRFAAAEQLEEEKTELALERTRLLQQLQRDFAERKKRLDDAILAFEETSRSLYESAGGVSAGSMTVEGTNNGPKFSFKIQGSRSKGITNMQIFCFDMMLMRLCSKRKRGPRFLIHDSHLFDGVDGRQVVSALKVGARTADEHGFQYIVTMNEDDAFKEITDDFDIRDHILPVQLTDATENGGLFGFRFE